MKRYFWSCCIVSIGFLLAPGSSFSAHMNVGCDACHDVSIDCFSCHNDESTRDTKALEVATHSSAVIGSDKFDPWERECLDCHHPHNPNGFVNGVVNGGISDNDIIKVDLGINYAVMSGTEVTFTLEEINILDSAWADPATWVEKSGPGRGLMFVMYYDQYQGYVSYEVIRTTVNSITIGNNYRMFPPNDHPLNAQLIYGMLIRDEVNGTPVKAAGPSTMANDESGTGYDDSPYGICQVCHTQTIHWRNDGSLADHFSGWKCTICHPHKEGFKVVPPPLFLCEDETSPPVWDCSGTWGGDNVVDNCGTCDNDPSNDCLEDCNGTWGGDAQLDACGVCGGDSTVYPDGSPCDLADRSGTATVTETGLMWQQATADVNNNGSWDTGDRLIFNDAMDYCDDLLFAGYTDWRLPSKDELKGLVVCADSAGETTTETPLPDGAYCGGAYVRPTIDQSVFNCAPSAYWSNGDNGLWYVNFLHGRAWVIWDTPLYLRCVRDI